MSKILSMRLSDPDAERFAKALMITHENRSEFIRQALDYRIDTVLKVAQEKQSN